MERLTYEYSVGEYTGWEVHGVDGVECGEVCKNVGRKGCAGCPIQEAIDRLAAYEDTSLTPEEAAGLWIYGNVIPPDGDFEKTIHAVEDALGFKLFVWQKNYLAYGEFRQMGVTTAKILRELLDVSGAPIDYSRHAGSAREKTYREELQKIKKKLDEAGIPTRKVFFSERDKRKEG